MAARRALLRLLAVLVVVLLQQGPQPSQAAAINSVMGPFRIVPGHLERCPPELEPPVPLTYYYHGTRDRKNHDLWWYSGNLTYSFTWDDNTTGDVNIASCSQRGGWKDNAYMGSMPRYCTAARNIVPDLWRNIMSSIYDDPKHFCPFYPGTFVTQRPVPTDFNVRRFPTFFYGRWRLTLRLLRTSDRNTLACIRAFGKTVPRLD